VSGASPVIDVTSTTTSNQLTVLQPRLLKFGVQVDF
jgi:hypothetical protein